MSNDNNNVDNFNSKSRSSNMMLNAFYGIFSYLMIIVTSFVLRKVFADKLGETYLGLNSLFTNIISMLSLTELGIGTAIVLFLYKPIAEHDTERIKTYMHFYKNAYRLIACIVFTLGMIVLLLLPFFIKDNDIEINKIRFYFILYVLNSSISYLLAYKKSMLYADQRNRVTSMIHMISKICMSLLQLVVLLLWGSFLGYIIVMLLATFCDNLSCSLYVDKHYSFLKEKSCVKLDKSERKEIYATVAPLLVQNLSVFLVDSIDNILISAFIGLSIVGKYSNYTLVLSTLNTLYYQVFSAFTASFGNLIVTRDKDYCEKVYSHICYLSFFITSVFAFCYISLIQPFVGLLFGEHFVMGLSVPICLTISFMVNAFTTPGSSAQHAVGMYNKDVGFLVAQGLLNLVISLVLVKIMGVVGVIIGTILAKSLTTLYSKDYVLYKFVFKKSLAKVMVKKFLYMIIIVALCSGGYYLFNVLWSNVSLLTFIAKIFASAAFIVFVLIVTTYKTEAFQYYLSFVKRLFTKDK